MGIDEIIGAIRRPEKTVALCLRGDLQADFERLERDFNRLDSSALVEDITPTGLSTSAVKAAQQMEEIRDQMQASMEVFALRALPRTDWLTLAREHPPTDDDTGDVHEATFFPALVAACCVTPEMTVGQASQLQSVLTEGQWMALASAAWDLNRDLQPIPYSLAASSRAISPL